MDHSWSVALCDTVHPLAPHMESQDLRSYPRLYTYIQYSLVAPTIGIVSIVRSIYGKPPFTIQVCLRGNLQAEGETTEEGIAVCILQSIWYHW